MSSDDNNGSGSPILTSGNGSGGSPPATNSENGNGHGDVVSATSNGSNGNGNGHEHPRSGTQSPNSLRLEQRNLAVLKLLDIDLGKAEMASKIARGRLLPSDTEIELITNVYGLNHSAPLNVHVYHATLAKITQHRNIPLISRKGRLPDYASLMRRRFYHQTMPLFYLKYATVFGDNKDNHLIDYANAMFSYIALSTGEKDEKEMIFDLTAEEAGTRNMAVSLSLKAANADFIAQNFSGICLDLDVYDGSVIRFTELATSHGPAENFEEHCMFNNSTTYFMNPSKFGYTQHDTPDLGNGKFLAVGATKSVLLIEGVGSGTFPNLSEAAARALNASNESHAAVVFDSKKSPFRQPEPLLDLVCRTLKINPNQAITEHQIDLLQPCFKNLTCLRTYGNQAAGLTMACLSNKTAREERVTEGTFAGLTIEEYFLQHYGITLHYPTWPLAEMRSRGKSFYFPIEVLQVADNQRVRSGSLLPEDTKQIIKSCAVLPFKKHEEVKRCVDAFGINGDSFCQNAGISITEEPLKVTARVLSPPEIFYRNGEITPKDGAWRMPRGATFMRSSTCTNWIAILIDHPYPRPYDLGKFEEFTRHFMGECRTRGLIFSEPQAVYKVSANNDDLDKLFTEARKNGIEFILFGHPDAETELHAPIKTFERKWLVVTQCVRTSTVDKVVDFSSKLTLENIVAKTNVKLGGHNYAIQLNDYKIDGKTLFIGLGVNHPAGGYTKAEQDAGRHEAVSILGYSANDTPEPGAFVGNFFVQPLYQDEQLTVLSELLNEVLNRFIENRGHAPARVMIYRSGCSEGQYGRVLKYEIPVILHFVGKFAPGAPVTLLVPSIQHNVRLFQKNINPSARAPEQNIPPGTVVDTTIVHGKFAEFYLNAHVAIQGTAKTPKYTVLYTSENNVSLDMYQRWTNGLCYSYQIVNSPVSVPAPVYIANCYAERGRQIANNFALTKLTTEQEGLGLMVSFSAESDEKSGKQEWVKKSFLYNYTHRPLRDIRFNA